MNIDHYKQRLLNLQSQIALRLEQNAETARGVTDDQPETGDVAQADELKDEYFSLAESDTAILGAVRDALQRIDEGTYGTCVIDGEPIDEKRLESVPWTPYCLKHQQEIEERAGLRTPTL